MDFGHGGKDSGAVGLKGIQEKKINYNVGKYLLDALIGKGYKVVMTRLDDSYLSIPERQKLINEYEPDISISIHHNAGKGDGFEVIHQLNSKKSEMLADLIASEFSKENNAHGKNPTYSKPNPNNPNRNYFGLLNVNCVSVITEFAFIDSVDVDEVDTLKDQQREAGLIFTAIERYFKEV